jgi:hypothetical protein
MQGPTHLVTGVLIQKVLRNTRPLPLRYFLVAFLAITSHGILDELAMFTYHPPVPLRDYFWISYHLIIAFLTIFVLFKYWKDFKLGLIFSVFPDFDWVIIHTSNILSFHIPFWEKAILHKFFFGFFDLQSLFSFLHALPDWSLEKKGIIFELALFAMLIILLEKGGKKKMGHIQSCEKTNDPSSKSITGQQEIRTWKDWIKEIEKGKFLGIWSLGTKSSQIIAVGLIALIGGIIFFLYGDYPVWLLMSSFIFIAGIVWLLHASWLWRQTWKLKEKRREMKDEESREEISMAIEFLEGHKDIDRIWGWVLIVIAGSIIVLPVNIRGKVLLIGGFIIALIILINLFFFLKRR